MSERIRLRVRRLASALDLPLPTYATAGSAGLDLLAAVADPLTLGPGERALVPTGIAVAIPTGYEGQVRARSGLALRAGLGMVNAPGTVDSDYRGEIGVVLINWGAEPHTVRRGDRVAQLVIAPIVQADVDEADVLDDTGRGAGGFGHTGVSADPNA